MLFFRRTVFGTVVDVMAQRVHVAMVVEANPTFDEPSDENRKW